MMQRKRKYKNLSEPVFRKTLAIFSELLGRPLSLNIGSQIQPSTNGKTIYIPRSMDEAGVRYLSYPLYVLFEHEIAHLLFNTDFEDFSAYKKTKENRELATACYNLVEDDRIESCWNLIYRTPFRRTYTKLFILPNVRRGAKMTILDVIMDVRGDFVRNLDDQYLQTWKDIRTIFDEVKEIVVTTATVRTADKLYDYIMNNGMGVGNCKCDLLTGEGNREKLNREGHKKLRKFRFDPNNNCQGQCGNMNTEDYKLLREMVERYGNLFKHGNVHQTGKSPPKHRSAEAERKYSEKFMDKLKQKLMPEYTPIKPENRVVGNIKFQKFGRRDSPSQIDKGLKCKFPFKQKDVRWFAEVGELDPDEYIQKTLRNDRNDVDYFEDCIQVRGMDVVFLVDFSGSMAGNYYYSYGSDRGTAGKEINLKQAIYTLWKSIENVPGINIQTIIFSGGSGTTTPIEIIRDPEELLWVYPSGATHTYRALDYVHRLLEKNKNNRRVIFLLTDGEPTPDDIIKNPYAYVEMVCKRIRKSRISLFTLFIENRGISPEKMKHFGNKSNCLYLPPGEIAAYLKREFTKLIYAHTRTM